MKMHTEAVIFDADGTLLDSRELVFQAYEHLLAQHGYRPPDRNELAKSMGKTTNEVYSMFAPEHDDETLTSLHREFQKQQLDLFDAYEGLHDLLDALKDGGLQMGICTSRGSNVIPLLEKARIQEYFGAIVHAEMVSKHKPDPEGLFKACEGLNVSPSAVVMVGDTDADIEAGKAAGVAFTIGITHGFGTREHLREAGADYIVDHLSDIVPIVLK